MLMPPQKQFSLMVGVLALIVFSSISVIAGPVPDTGQTQDYTSTFGEDSDYTINPPSYTKLGQNSIELPDNATQADGWIMTRDNVTGLIWEVKQAADGITDYGNPHDADNTYAWYDPNPATNGGDDGLSRNGTDTQDFIDALNGAEFGSFCDWRLPTRKELCTIVDYGRFSPSINPNFFPNAISSYYWSSTTYARSTDYAWRMYFYDGCAHVLNKSLSFWVRAVRGGQ